MGVSGRDFLGSAAFLAGVKGPGSARQSAAGPEQPADPADREPSAEGVLALIEKLDRATVKDLAEGFGDKIDRITPLVERLEKLDLAKKSKEGEETVYTLSDLGRKARKYARIAQPGY